MSFSVNRRRVLRGTLQGLAVAVGLPFLECSLNANGTALASGAPLPVRFGTWFWGLGMNKKIWIPTKTGPDYDLPEELQSIKAVKEHVNVFTNFNVFTDGKPNLCHYTGWVNLRCGTSPTGRDALPNESIDVTVSDVIGRDTRFSSLEMAATGNPHDSYSFRSIDAVNPPEVSVIDFYQRVFGPDFQDPNSANFKPDPRLMIRDSVVSSVMEDVSDLNKTLGQADKIRLDQYLTSLRGLEKRLALQMQKPAPAGACHIPAKINQDIPVGLDSELVAQRHNMMTDILVMALACNQTKVFNMLYSASLSAMVKTGYSSTHHTVTHEEPVDERLGYQPMNSWFLRRSMDAWAYFVSALASVKEGDGSLLDNTLVFAHSDAEQAQIHSLRGIPMMTAGAAGGRVRTGLHIDGGGDPGSRVGFTMLRAMGVPVVEWGVGSMRTDKVVGEILT